MLPGSGGTIHTFFSLEVPIGTSNQYQGELARTKILGVELTNDVRGFFRNWQALCLA
jgi:hypothetical protein